MNNFTKIFAGVVLAGSTAMASADPVFVDYNDDGVTSDDFTSFVFNSFDPTSAYLDLEGDGISNGTYVFDSGSGTLTGLSPLAFPLSTDGFNEAGGWGLSFEYELFGTAFLATDVDADGFFDGGVDQLAANFVDGYINFSYTAGGTQTGEVLSIGVTSSAYNIGNGLNFTVFGEPVSATNLINTVQVFDGMTGLGDLLASPDSDEYGLGSFLTLKILDATQAPTTDDTFATTTFQQGILDTLGVTLTADSDWLTRTTTIDSSNLYITAVSAPTNIALMGLGLIGLGFSRRLAKK
jgi:hypothetical protein